MFIILARKKKKKKEKSSYIYFHSKDLYETIYNFTNKSLLNAHR